MTRPSKLLLIVAIKIYNIEHNDWLMILLLRYIAFSNATKLLVMRPI